MTAGAWDAGIRAVGSWLFTVTWQVAVLAAVAWLITKLWGLRLSPRTHYALWAIVVLRLALPPVPGPGIGFTPPVSLGAAAPVEALGTANPPPPTWRGPSYPIGGTVPRPGTPPDPEGKEAIPAAQVPAKRLPVLASPDAAVGAGTFASASAPGGDGKAAFFRSWVTWWAAGALLVLGRGLVLHCRFRRRLFREGRRPEGTLAAALEGRTGGLRVLVTGAVSTPFLMGWRRPFLVLPADLMGRVGAAGIGHVVAHELAHARHRDVLVNWVSLVLGAVHWFNPCAWWVQRRLWAAREATRDFEVVGRPGGPSPHAYGETLLRLAAAPARVPTTLAGAVTDSAVLRWRIHMLTIDDARRRSRWFGLALLLAFSGVTLLGAAREPGAASAPVPDDAQPRQGIRVEREGPPPPWMSELEKRLEMEVDADFETVPLEDVLALVRRAGKINVVLSGEAEDRGNEEVRLSPGRRSLRSLLEAACGQLSLGYALVAEAVLVGDPDRVRVLERRIYDVGPLLAAHADVPDRIQDLAELVRELMGEAWEHEGVSMRPWNGLLLVTQTAQQHARLHRILERILHPETPDPVERTPEMVRLEEALQKKGSVAYDETPFAAVRSDLHSRFGITIRPNEALLEDDRPVTLVLDDLRASEIVAWIARQLGCVFVPDRGTLVPSEAPVLDTRYYDVSGLVGTDDDQQALLELIREIVEPDTWDEHPMAMIRFWDRLMIIVQTDRTHEQIVAFLAALRRARS